MSSFSVCYHVIVYHHIVKFFNFDLHIIKFLVNLIEGTALQFIVIMRRVMDCLKGCKEIIQSTSIRWSILFIILIVTFLIVIFRVILFLFTFNGIIISRIVVCTVIILIIIVFTVADLSSLWTIIFTISVSITYTPFVVISCVH